MRQYIIIFLSLCTFFLNAQAVFPSPLQNTPTSAKIQNISSRKYFNATYEAISNAKKSIYVVMYLAVFDERKNNQVTKLIDGLVDAKNRDVKVTVILDQNLAFEKKGELGMSEPYRKNKKAFEYLKKHGVDVVYDDMRIYTHSKCIIIDEKIVILGSANWSQSALMRNNEMSLLIESPNLAKQLIKEFKNIEIDEESRHIEAQEYIELNESALIEGLRACVKHRSISAWNIYFYLVSNYKADQKLEIEYKTLTPHTYRRPGKKTLEEADKRVYVRDSLKSLEKKKLLKYLNPKETKGKARLILSPFKNKSNALFKIPKTFFEWEWNKRLTLAAQYCYFIALIQGGEDHRAWRASIETTLSKKYKISVKSFTRGFKELRHWNLIKIKYARMIEKRNTGPNTYRLMPLYKMADFEKKKKKLIAKYGKKRFDHIRKYAEIVFCENDLYEIEDIMRLEDEYGEKRVKAAFEKVSKKAPNNSKKSKEYVVGILKSKDY